MSSRRSFSGGFCGAATSFHSIIGMAETPLGIGNGSTETAEKLLTKLSGFLISRAMPAVNWPSEGSGSLVPRLSIAHHGPRPPVPIEVRPHVGTVLAAWSFAINGGSAR